VSLTEDVTRVDIEFHGLDEAEASYEGRVFVNNPEANEDTPPSADNRYAGSFFVFGVHGAHYGNVGQGEDRSSQIAHDPRRPHAAKGKMVVTATDLLKRASDAGQDVRVTVVPVNVAPMSEEEEDIQDVVKFDHLSIVAYRGEGPDERFPAYQPEEAIAPSMPTSPPQ
jgi:hypothetical protein